jgi:hypothetical protein
MIEVNCAFTNLNQLCLRCLDSVGIAFADQNARLLFGLKQLGVIFGLQSFSR